MLNYWENHLFPQFLQSVDSITLSELSDQQIEKQLNYLVIRAIIDFKFPKISLKYDFEEVLDSDSHPFLKYYFLDEEVRQEEFNVILARMKQYWIEFQISQERLFANAYYDRDVRLHSPGNTIDKLIKMFTTFRDMADMVEFNYGRISEEGFPTLGDINE